LTIIVYEFDILTLSEGLFMLFVLQTRHQKRISVVRVTNWYSFICGE